MAIVAITLKLYFHKSERDKLCYAVKDTKSLSSAVPFRLERLLKVSILILRLSYRLVGLSFAQHL